MSTRTELSAGPTNEELVELPFAEKELKISGKAFKFRELSVEENDQAADAAKRPDGSIDGRLMMRLMIMSSSVAPKLTSEAMGKLPQRAYIRIYDAVSALNSVDLDEDAEDEGKS